MRKLTEKQKERLLKCCRYYKGEKENPFDWRSQNAANQFWNYEESFYNGYLASDNGNSDPEQALKDYLDELFWHLSEKYETSPEHFKKKYYGI